jgi:hypothetical protein
MKIDNLLVSRALSPNLKEARASIIKTDGNCVGRYCGSVLADATNSVSGCFLFKGRAPDGSNGLVIDVRSGESSSKTAYVCLTNLVSGVATVFASTNRLSVQFIVPGIDEVQVEIMTDMVSVEYLNGIVLTVDIF